MRQSEMAGAPPQGRMAMGRAIGREADTADNTDDLVCVRGHMHRHSGIAGLYKSRDVVQMQLRISVGKLAHDEAPMPPDPSGRSLNKRQ
jgi:hypothetical protein